MDNYDEQRAQFISTNPRAREVFLDGYERGYKKAVEVMDDLIGVTLLSESFLDDPANYHQKFAKSALNAIDVVAARQRMGTDKTGPAPQPLYPLQQAS